MDHFFRYLNQGLRTEKKGKEKIKFHAAEALI